jgi:translation initiation factor 2B subunit (eIF-2B alpha/beta/delta family)
MSEPISALDARMLHAWLQSAAFVLAAIKYLFTKVHQANECTEHLKELNEQMKKQSEMLSTQSEISTSLTIAVNALRTMVERHQSRFEDEDRYARNLLRKPAA